MLALCAISLFRIFSLDVDRGDTTSISGLVMGIDEHPTDTVYIRAQRVDFATVGRVVRQFQSCDNDQLLTAAM